MRVLVARCLAACLAVLLAGCDAPLTDAVISPEAEAASYPELVPLEPLIARMNAEQIDAPAVQAGLESRVASLNARAETLRRAGVDESERERLQGGLD